MDNATMLWNLTAAFFVGYGYLAAFLFIAGLIYRLYLYIRTPAPLKIVTTPAPETSPGVVARIAGDVLIFPDLFKADKWLWLGAWLFHAFLFLILTRHSRYFLYPVPDFVVDLNTLSMYAGFLFPLPALYLFWRRLALPRMLYISGVPDYFALLLLTAIASTGMLMQFYARVYLVDVKAFIVGLMTLTPVQPPPHPTFLVHFVLVGLLMIYFPFSKLMHAGGIFFSPTHNQRNNLTRQRHINPWNEEVKVD